MLAYRIDKRWVQVEDNFKITLELSELDDSTLTDLIEKSIEKIFPEIDKEERKAKIEEILNVAFKLIANKIASDINYLDHIE